MTGLRPLGHRVVIRPEAAATRTASGLHVVEHWKPEQRGTVVEVAASKCPKCGIAEPLKPGDDVIFSWQSGQEVFINNERVFLMNAADILAIVGQEV